MTGEIPDNSSAKSAFELWKFGVPLASAPDAFGATRRLSKIRREARSNALATAELGKANFRKIGKDADAVYDALGAVQAYVAETGQVRLAKEARLFERLRLGELVAFGFPVHDRNATEPEQVPIFLLNRDCVKWRTRELVGYSRHYADVTVTEHCVAADLIPREPKKIGAPSFARQLEIIARELAKRMINLDGQPLKLVGEQYRRLGMELALPMFDGTRPSNETVRRFITTRPDTKR